MNDTKLISRLKIIVKSTGSQSAFARMAGVDPSYINKILKGERDITFEIIRFICFELGYSPAWVIGGVGDKKVNLNESTKLLTEIQVFRTEIQILHATIANQDKIISYHERTLVEVKTRLGIK